MIAFCFGPEDLGRVRFAISPLFDLVASFEVVREPAASGIHAPWAREARERLRGLDLSLLDAVVPERGYRPDFIDPPPERPIAGLAAELARVRATPPDQVARELGWAYPRRPLPPAARVLIDDPQEGLARLTAVMEEYWRRAVAPHWPALLATLEADVAGRAARLAAGGPLAAIADLHPDVGWRDMAVEVRRDHHESVALAGRGLLLVPSAFAWGRVWAMIDPPWQPAIVYPARGVGGLWAPAERAGGDALAALLGRRRARILAELASPATTQELALRLRASPGGVSEHLGVLRAAGLVVGRREGRAVRYARTEAADGLISNPLLER